MGMAVGECLRIQHEKLDFPASRFGRVRWTVCAMLFVAASINYMDRQVIAILKPTLEHSPSYPGEDHEVDPFSRSSKSTGIMQ
jgi:hypothetical protein